MTKIKLTAILAATVLVAGFIATATLVSAAPPSSNPGQPFDAILQKLDQIITTISDTDTEVDNIEAKLDDGTTGLGAIKGVIDTTDTEVGNIEAKLDDSNFGLEEIKKEIQQIALDLQDKKKFYEKSETGIIDITDTAITGATPGNIKIKLTCPAPIAPDSCAFNVLSFRVVATGLTGPQTMHFARTITIDGTKTDLGFPARVEIDASDQETNVLVESGPLSGVHLAASDEIGIRYVIGTDETVVKATLTVTVVGQMPQGATIDLIVPDVIRAP